MSLSSLTTWRKMTCKVRIILSQFSTVLRRRDSNFQKGPNDVLLPRQVGFNEIRDLAISFYDLWVNCNKLLKNSAYEKTCLLSTVYCTLELVLSHWFSGFSRCNVLKEQKIKKCYLNASVMNICYSKDKCLTFLKFSI